MSSNIDMKTVREQTKDLIGGMVNEIYFIDTKPNFIYVTNLGTGQLFIDDQPNVNENSYEILAGTLMKRAIVKPLGLTKLYIYTDADCKVKIESGVAELSISDIPMTQIVATLSNSLSISTVDVTGITNALPAGNNKIGNVGILSMPDVNVLTLPSLPAGSNNIGDVDVVTMPDLTIATLPSLPAGTNNIGVVDVNGWNDMITLLTDIKTLITTGNSLLTDIKTNTTPA